MTLPAALSIAAATLGVAVALLSWRLATAPGWQEMRRFALISLTAGLYCLCESFTTLNVPGSTVAWASRIGMFVAAFHGPSWVLYIAAQEGRPAKLWEKGVFVVGMVVAVLSAIPGAIVTDRVTHRAVDWLGVTYADVEATTFGAAIYGLYCATLLIPLVVYVRKALRRKPAAAAHAAGLTVLAAAATNDSFVGAGMWNAPYMLSLGFMAAVLASGGVLLSRFVDQARELESLSRDLEAQVASRTDELARAVDALLRAEKLAALGRLAAGAAHELNNPCSVVSTNLAYLRHALVEKGSIPDDADRCLDESVGAANRIARIIRQLVDAGRAGAKVNIEMCSFAVRPVVEKAVASARVGLRSAPKVDVSGDDDLQASGDPALLQQIIVNLVVNAAHAVEARNGAGHVHVRVEANTDNVHIDVEDDGSGISKSHIDHIFEPFFTTKRPGQGMGLGLAVSLGLARAQGGDIVVASTGPTGTTMRVHLGSARNEP
jgi:signal transduction histidine kinase